MFRHVPLSLVSLSHSSNTISVVTDIDDRRDTIKQYMVKRLQRRFISNSRKAREGKEAKRKRH